MAAAEYDLPVSEFDENPLRSSLSIRSHKSLSNAEGPSDLVASKPVTLRLDHLSVRVRDKKGAMRTILDDLCGEFATGTITCIMGASGSGKTTLLNEIAGFPPVGIVEGNILLNGFKQDRRKQRKMMKYVQQDDCLMGHLTVRETLYYASYFTLPFKTPAARRKERVDELLKLFNLVACQNVIVGAPDGRKGISGGQRKRCHIAVEMMNDPSLLLLDEPTTGLDARTAYSIMSIARDLAHTGRTVICTIHQPSYALFTLFDNCLLMSQGQIVYFGGTTTVEKHFASIGLVCPEYYNPADFIVETAGSTEVEKLDQLKQAYKNSDMYLRESPEGDDPYPSYGFLTRYALPLPLQFFLLLKRAVLMNIRNRPYVASRVMSQIVGGIILGILYWQTGDDQTSIHDRLSVVLFALLFVTLINIVPAVVTFPTERVVFQREHLNNWYGVFPYYMAKTASEVPLTIIPPVLFTAIWYAMVIKIKYWDLWSFIIIVLVTQIHALVANAQGMVISVAAPTMTSGVFIAPMTTLPLIFFSGFAVLTSNLPFLLCDLPFVPIDGKMWPPPAQWFHDAGGCWSVQLSYFYYSFGTIVRQIFKNLTFTCPSVHIPDFPIPPFHPTNGSNPHDHPIPPHIDIPDCCTLKNGEDVVDHFGFYHWWNDWLITIPLLLAVMLLLRMIAYIVLKRKTKGGPFGLSFNKIKYFILAKIERHSGVKLPVDIPEDAEELTIDVDDVLG
jgi:ATP-binding cassette, subfamily G (WHITE), member 1